MKLFLASLLVALAAACASSAPTTPAQTIFQIESDYNAAAQIVLVYKALPRCGTTDASGARIVLCSDLDTINRLKIADNAVYASLVAAQRVALTPGAGANVATATLAAQQALQVLTAITATLPVKKATP